MCWIDYKKAFDSVPHAWILSVLNLYKVSPTIVKFFEKSMATWRTVLKAGPSVIGMVSIRSGIFLGGVISPLLFCIALATLSFLLEREKLGYSFKGDPVINHLLYMNDLKLFAKSEEQLETLVQITHNFSASMGMQFGFQKCASVIMQRGRQCSSSGITLPDGLITAMTPLEYYKYLCIYEADSINCPKTKEIVQAEYFRRLRKVLSSQLHARHKIIAINEFAITVLRYSATIIDWTKNELQVLDRKTRKTFTMNGGLHPCTCRCG